jgi:hypothetical protein
VTQESGDAEGVDARRVRRGGRAMSYALELYVEERGHDGWEYTGALAASLGHVEAGTPGRRPEPFYWTTDAVVLAILTGFHTSQPGLTVPFAPITPPRGLPADLSPELAAWTAYTPPEEHRFPAGWLTLAEVLAFDWAGCRYHWGAGLG